MFRDNGRRDYFTLILEGKNCLVKINLRYLKFTNVLKFSRVLLMYKNVLMPCYFIKRYPH